jgi:Integrator complex subunit 2
VVCFLTGLLLGGEPATRTWLSQFVRAGQKRRSCPALTRLRQELTRRLEQLLAACHGSQLPAEHVLEATALLRLYAALRGIAGN